MQYQGQVGKYFFLSYGCYKRAPVNFSLVNFWKYITYHWEVNNFGIVTFLILFFREYLFYLPQTKTKKDKISESVPNKNLKEMIH